MTGRDRPFDVLTVQFLNKEEAMPVHRQKKDTTTTPAGSTQDQIVPPLPEQQTFQQYLRELARGAIRIVLEDVMR